MLRSVDNPNEVFTRVEFDSVEDATAFRDRLVASGALDQVGVLTVEYHVYRTDGTMELVENPTY